MIDETIFIGGERAVEAPMPRVPNLDRPPDPRLVAEGWERRFMVDKRRVAEFTDLYSALGYEVRAEPIRPDEVGPECSDCTLVMYQIFVTLYTRKRSDG